MGDAADDVFDAAMRQLDEDTDDPIEVGILGITLGWADGWDGDLDAMTFYDFDPTPEACKYLALFACKQLTLNAQKGEVSMWFGLDDDLKEQKVDRCVLLEFLLNIANGTWS